MEYKLEKLKIQNKIMDIIEDHIMVCKLDGTIIFSNRAFQNYLGYEEDELNNKNLLDIIADTHIEKAKKLIFNTSEKNSKDNEFLFKSKSNIIKLNIKTFQEDNLIYIYGNEKYLNHEKIQRRFDIEIRNAIQIHKQSLPKNLPESEHISFSSLYIPAQDLGGDLYDAFKVDNGLLDDYYDQYVCFVADVSGHGLDSAMLAIFVKDTITSYFNHKHSSGQVLSPKEIMDFFVDQYIKEGYPSEYLLCLFLLVIDLKTDELIYCNAGFHMPPILVEDGGNIVHLDKGGLPITTAFGPNLYNYKDNYIDLSQNMTLFIMSDGLGEQRSGKKTYEDRFKNLCGQIYDLKPSEIVDEIEKDFTDFIEYNDIADDITLLVAKLTR